MGGDGVVTPTERDEYDTFTGTFWAYDGTTSLCAPPAFHGHHGERRPPPEALPLTWYLCTARARYRPRCPKQAPAIVARREPTGTLRSQHEPQRPEAACTGVTRVGTNRSDQTRIGQDRWRVPEARVRKRGYTVQAPLRSRPPATTHSRS